MADIIYGDSPIGSGGIYGDILYGAGESTSGDIGGILTENVTLVGVITFTSDVIIPSGVTLSIHPLAELHTEGFRILVQPGGYLNTFGFRLPKSSTMDATLVIT